MSSRPTEDPQEHAPATAWRAPGTEPAASPLVAAALDALEASLHEVSGLSLSGLGDADVTRLLDDLSGSTGRLTHALARVAAEADRRRLGDEVGARHTHQWWARRARMTHPEAARLVRLGKALDTDVHAPVATAMAEGSALADQASAIIHAVDSLPAATDRHVRVQARDHLLAAAHDHDAKALRHLGKRILDVVAPALGEAHEQKVLEQEEARAEATTSLWMYDDGHGRVHGRFTLPSHQGAMLKLALHALANPARHDQADLTDPGTGQWVPTPQRLGAALGELIERYPSDRLPQTGGVNATVVVTMSLESLQHGLGAATLSSGHRLSPGVVRRLACEAGIVPAVLGGGGVLLDLGRTRRFHTKKQRLALTVRDQGCTAEGCSHPPDGCHVHHDLAWVADRGPTDLAHGRMLCPHHHRRAHDSHYEMRVAPDNSVAFHRRT